MSTKSLVHLLGEYHECLLPIVETITQFLPSKRNTNSSTSFFMLVPAGAESVHVKPITSISMIPVYTEVRNNV